MIHQILANDRFWVTQPNVLIQRYEDLLQDPAGSVSELASHLGIPLPEGEAIRIANAYSREANRARADALRRRLQEAGVNLDSPSNLQICDPTTLLHWNHMRPEFAGSWQSTATPAERRILERLCGPWLDAHGYPLESSATPRTVLSRQALHQQARETADLWTGRSTILLRSASDRFPATARAVKRLLGLPAETAVGATAWRDPVPADSVPTSAGREDASKSTLSVVNQ
jgi:hypothetical protein